MTYTAASHYEAINTLQLTMKPNLPLMRGGGGGRIVGHTHPTVRESDLQSASVLLTIKVGYPHQLKDSNDDQRVGGCIRVHQLQHVHPILLQTHK